MIRTLAFASYRSLRELRIAVGPLTAITGGNGTGKSNVYRALRLLVDAANGELARRHIIEAARRSQVIVVSHAAPLVDAICKARDAVRVEHEKRGGETQVHKRAMLDAPSWKWTT